MLTSSDQIQMLLAHSDLIAHLAPLYTKPDWKLTILSENPGLGDLPHATEKAGPAPSSSGCGCDLSDLTVTPQKSFNDTIYRYPRWLHITTHVLISIKVTATRLGPSWRHCLGRWRRYQVHHCEQASSTEPHPISSSLWFMFAKEM